MDPEEREKHPKRSDRYDAPAYEVVSNIFTALTNKKSIVPGGTFQSNDGHQAVKCNRAFV